MGILRQGSLNNCFFPVGSSYVSSRWSRSRPSEPWTLGVGGITHENRC